jgi:hypothetical protein
MEGEKLCAHDDCKKPFTPKSAAAKYCSDKCRNKAFHKQNPTRWKDRRLNGLSTPTPTEPTQPLAMNLNRLDTMNFNPATTLVIDLYKEQVKKLETELDKANGKIEKLTTEKGTIEKEKSAIEKSLEEANGKLKAEPTGLGALMKADSATIKEIGSGLIEIVRELKGVMPQQQLGAGAPSPLRVWIEGFLKWLEGVPAEHAKSFMEVAADLASSENDNVLNGKLQNIRRALMAPGAAQGQKQITGTDRYS